MPIDEQARIALIMEKLDCTEAEARDVIEYDKMVDKSSNSVPLEHDLPPEKLEIARKFAHTGTRERKPMNLSLKRTSERTRNAGQDAIIDEILQYLTEKVYFLERF